jgi:hypothetical protein
MEETVSYTNKIDLPARFNRLDGIDKSIKTTGKKGMVCMGDCKRLYTAVSSESRFHMIVIMFEQVGNTKKLVEIVELDLTSSRESLFGDLTLEEIESLDRVVKAVPQKRRPTPEEHKHMYSIRDELQKKSGAIHLDIKCDSKQSRLQCSFNRFQAFLEKNPERIVARSATNEFRGGRVSMEIQSSRRVFRSRESN